MRFPQVGFWNSLSSPRWKTLQAKRIKEDEFPAEVMIMAFFYSPPVEIVALSKVTRTQPTRRWEQELHNCPVTIKLMQGGWILFHRVVSRKPPRRPSRSFPESCLLTASITRCKPDESARGTGVCPMPSYFTRVVSFCVEPCYTGRPLSSIVPISDIDIRANTVRRLPEEGTHTPSAPPSKLLAVTTWERPSEGRAPRCDYTRHRGGGR